MFVLALQCMPAQSTAVLVVADLPKIIQVISTVMGNSDLLVGKEFSDRVPGSVELAATVAFLTLLAKPRSLFRAAVGPSAWGKVESA